MRILLALSVSWFLTSCSLFKETPPAPLNEVSRDKAKEVDRVVATKDPEVARIEKIEEEAEQDIKIRGEDAALKAMRKRVLILPFQNRSSYGGTELGVFAAKEVSDRLSSGSEFILVTHADFPDYETVIPVRGKPDLRSLFERARAYGVSAVVTGSIDDVQIQEKGNQVGLLRTRYNTVTTSLRLQLWDVTTERSLLNKLSSAEVTEEYTKFFGSRAAEGSDSDRAETAVHQALDKILLDVIREARRLTWVGRIAKVDIHRYYINAGQASGLTRGQILRVFGEASPVVDYESRALIGMAPGRFKGLLKVVDFFGDDGAVAVLHSGETFKEKDRVEIFLPPQP